MGGDPLALWTAADTADPQRLAARLNELAELLVTDNPFLVGAKGDKGDKGEPGTPGTQGPQGPQGDMGPEGPQGQTGPQGNKGDTGEMGPAGVGPKGDKGDRGDRGEKGEVGKRGPYVAFDGRVLPRNPGQIGTLWNDQGTVKVSEG